MRKKKKIKSEIEKKYYKERKLVLQRISRAKKRGFAVPEKLLPAIPKKITAGSVRRLEKLSAKYIQEKSEYKGKKGAEARREYRKEFTKKRKITKLENKMKLLIQLLIERGYFENDLKNKDEKELEKLLKKTPESREPIPEESELIYQEIMRILSSGANRNYCFVGINYLNSEIKSRGFQEVMKTINESPEELKSDSNIIAFASDQEQIQMALSEFITLVSGRVLDSKESMKVAEEIEESYFNQNLELEYF